MTPRAQEYTVMPQRFWDKVNKLPEPVGIPENAPRWRRFPCWVWTASTTSIGYGHFRVGRNLRMPHVLAYEAVFGCVPAGLELDHLCRNRACLQPEHLEPVTHAENMRRSVAWNSLKTHCKHGHEFSEENTYTFPNGERGCRTCFRVRGREYYARFGNSKKDPERVRQINARYREKKRARGKP